MNKNSLTELVAILFLANPDMPKSIRLKLIKVLKVENAK
jgi:hypothetical protein